MVTRDEDKLLTVREVARSCGRSEETVRRWIWSGKLAAQKIGNQLFVESATVEQIAAKQRHGKTPEDEDDDRMRRLFLKYDYSPVLESLRESRGQILPLKDDILRHIEEDEALQDEMFGKYGPVDAVEIVKQVREG